MYRQNCLDDYFQTSRMQSARRPYNEVLENALKDDATSRNFYGFRRNENEGLSAANRRDGNEPFGIGAGSEDWFDNETVPANRPYAIVSNSPHLFLGQHFHYPVSNSAKISTRQAKPAVAFHPYPNVPSPRNKQTTIILDEVVPFDQNAKSHRNYQDRQIQSVSSSSNENKSEIKENYPKALIKPQNSPPSTSNTNKFSLDKQKNSHLSGTRIFTCSVEKAIKWFKIIQNINIDYLYEVIARCVSKKSGNGCEKHILVRSSSGPVLQVVFYEIDFLMPEIRVGSNLKIVGKMIGTNRMMAYKVREVIAFEEASLPRLSAISQHMITKLETSSSA